MEFNSTTRSGFSALSSLTDRKIERDPIEAVAEIESPHDDERIKKMIPITEDMELNDRINSISPRISMFCDEGSGREEHCVVLRTVIRRSAGEPKAARGAPTVTSRRCSLV